MAQRLQVQIKDGNGAEKIKTVEVLRIWQDASGRAIYLHTNGLYGTKTGAPVKSASEFGIITNKFHHKAAMNWWAAVGEKLSRDFFEKQASREKILAGDYQVQPGVSSDLDAVMYQKRPLEGNTDWSQPFSWMSIFKKRPDWWGTAKLIQFQDWRYREWDTEAVAHVSEPETTSETISRNDTGLTVATQQTMQDGGKTSLTKEPDVKNEEKITEVSSVSPGGEDAGIDAALDSGF